MSFYLKPAYFVGSASFLNRTHRNKTKFIDIPNIGQQYDRAQVVTKMII